MIALVTGASSGIGKDMSIYLAKLGYDIIGIARNMEELEKVKKKIEDEYTDRKMEVISMSLSDPENCTKLYNIVKEKHSNIDILVNNAGFGLFGEFTDTNIQTELDMIDTNIKAVHILTKLFLQDMVKQDKGHILNVASLAGMMPGPLMATYYASKNYVVRLTQAIRQELKKKRSNVKISVFCPGPVKTNFNKVADVNFSMPGKDSKKVSKYAIDKMLKGKLMILPGFTEKSVRILTHIVPDTIVMKFCYYIQKKKKE